MLENSDFEQDYWSRAATVFIKRDMTLLEY